MVTALGAGDTFAGYFHLSTHAFFKALLFLAAGSLIHAVHSNELKDMGGLFKKMPFSGAVFIIGAVALAGVPPFAGFFSKDLILEAVEHHHLYVPLAALAIAAFLTAFYMTRTVMMALFGAPSHAAEHAHEPGIDMKLPLGILERGKAGFNVPMAAWLNGDLRSLLRDTLSTARVQSMGLWSPPAVERLIDAHARKERDHSRTLWALLCFAAWNDRHRGGRSL
jgi:NADH-quinone oxidoreductase subunit L